VVLATPTFDVIARDAQANGAEVRRVPLTPEYAHDLDAMLKRVDASTSLVYICNPNNPTGTLTQQKEVEAFVEKLPANTKVLMDEAYHDYVAPGSDYKSWISRAGADPRLIVLRTFSKVYGMAGLRIGYSVASTETARQLTPHRLQFGVGLVGARAAKVAAEDAAYIKTAAQRNADVRGEFFRQAKERKLSSIDSQTNFALLATQRPAEEIAAELRERGVLIAGWDNNVRVSFGLPVEMRGFWSAWDRLAPRAN
jgi:histidinol-phosphate aminotransferase